jgi:hypothetical protein
VSAQAPHASCATSTLGRSWSGRANRLPDYGGDQEAGRDADRLVRAERTQRIEPLLWRATQVELALFDFRSLADARLDGGIGDGNEMPWLLVCAAGRGSRR